MAPQKTANTEQHPQTVCVHVRIGALEKQEGFGLHVWGSAAASATSWESALKPSGEDWFGLIFDVAVAPSKAGSPSAEMPALGMLLHKGEDKRTCVEFAASDLPAAGSTVWIGLGADILTEEPSPADVPVGDLNSQGARAHWLTATCIAWRAAAVAPAGSKFYLHSAREGQTLRDAGSAGVQGEQPEDGPWELQLLQKDLTPALAQAHPYLAGCALLTVPELDDAKALCRCQLAVSMLGPDGKPADCTGVQLGALLDELFAYDGPLGCHPLRGDKLAGVNFSIWCPTALSVQVDIFTSATGRLSETRQMKRQLRSAHDGVWHLSGPVEWWGVYYSYRVEAYHPSVGKVVTAEVPDPYSRACAADAARTLACHMPTWDAAVPGNDRGAWIARGSRPLSHRGDAVIYELHVRDFSANDETVPARLRGKYLAFEQLGTHGDMHLRRLVAAGITHVQLLPTYDFGSVPERAEDRKEQRIPTDEEPDSERQQEAAAEVADCDAFNWGYDPVLYDVPEGSYATQPDGGARILEHRRMVDALHAKGLRVVLDVVYNHTLASGPEGRQSVLDKCVPAYYHRRAENGAYENSTCMNNTATERYMMDRLVRDSILHWATEYRVDGFRFDLMGHLPMKLMKRIRDMLDSLTLKEHSIDGQQILLYGEGWEFGEVANGQRGQVAVQQQLAGTGIGAFNDRIRDSVIGGTPFIDPRTQGFATGLVVRSWQSDAGVEQGSPVEQEKQLRKQQDQIRLCLAASLKAFCLSMDYQGQDSVRGDKLQEGGLAYTASPSETINYVSAHDNETLFDNTAWKMSPSLFSPEERMRGNWMATSLVALAHGVPFFHAGDELLRSKSLDRDSYNSGDWFNVLDFTGQRSAFGTGLPVKSKNGEKWDLMRPLLRDSSVRPTQKHVAATTKKFCELLRIRRSTPLIGLLEAEDVLTKVDFPGCGPDQLPGVIVMQTSNGESKGGGDGLLICPNLARVVIVFSARLEPIKVQVPAPNPSCCGGKLPLRLHPLQAISEDVVTMTACVERDELVVPPQTAAVFVEPLPGHEEWAGDDDEPESWSQSLSLSAADSWSQVYRSEWFQSYTSWLGCVARPTQGDCAGYR